MEAHKVLAATLLIFATTADDAIWLIPMLSPEKYSLSARVIHCVAFIITLQLACLCSWLVYLFFGKSLQGYSEESAEKLLQLVGLIMAWSIAIALFAKKMHKRWNRSQKKSASTGIITEGESKIGYDSISNASDRLEIGTVESDSSYSNTSQFSSGPQISLVCAMTTAGALDEMICFPTFLLGGVFSFGELSVGCILACICVIVVVAFMIKSFKPILDFFDSIPLYAIMAAFATFMTVDYICF
jgi:hypothetical protein